MTTRVLLLLLTLRHDCCPLDGGVTCPDLQHCCPSSAPVCDDKRQLCVSEDGKVAVPWTDKTKAKAGPHAAEAPKELSSQPSSLTAVDKTINSALTANRFGGSKFGSQAQRIDNTDQIEA